jgi:nitrogen-specific signal transduction histidine kinase
LIYTLEDARKDSCNINFNDFYRNNNSVSKPLSYPVCPLNKYRDRGDGDFAIQAMPNGGTLTIRHFTTEDNACIEVQDTGAGIPKQYIDKIFEPLFTTKSKGQGLGLKVCKRLIESQNGTISVESQENSGTTFTVKLPIRR